MQDKLPEGSMDYIEALRNRDYKKYFQLLHPVEREWVNEDYGIFSEDSDAEEEVEVIDGDFNQLSYKIQDVFGDENNPVKVEFMTQWDSGVILGLTSGVHKVYLGFYIDVNGTKKIYPTNGGLVLWVGDKSKYPFSSVLLDLLHKESKVNP